MALTNCPECNGQVSTSADTCPHCGYRLKGTPVEPVQYETKTETISYWTKNGLNEKLDEFIKQGWEVVTVKENFWRGGALRHVCDVVLKRTK